MWRYYFLHDTHVMSMSMRKNSISTSEFSFVSSLFKIRYSYLLEKFHIFILLTFVFFASPLLASQRSQETSQETQCSQALDVEQARGYLCMYRSNGRNTECVTCGGSGLTLICLAGPSPYSHWSQASREHPHAPPPPQQTQVCYERKRS